MKMICPRAAICNSTFCYHKKPHDFSEGNCNKECDDHPIVGEKCVPYNDTTLEDLEYTAALKLLALLAPALRPNSEGMYSTANGEKSVVGVYRLIRDNV